MDRYKKTSLKFDKNLGYGRNYRAVEINASRAEARHTRFSMQRLLDDKEVEESENQPKPQSKIATFGKRILKPTRDEMLQKWKEEKMIKRQQELKNKKPTFRLGGVATTIPKPGSVNLLKSSILRDSKKITFNSTNSSRISQESQIQSFNIKPLTNQYNNPRVKKESHIQVPNNSKTGLLKPSFISSKLNKNEEIQVPSNSKTGLLKPSFISSKLNKNEESHIQVPNNSKTGLLKPSFISSKLNKNEVQSFLALPKSTESKIRKKPEQIQSFPELPKSTESKIHKKPEQTQPKSIPKPSQNRIPGPKTSQLQNSGRIVKAPIKAASQIKQMGIPSKTGSKLKPETKISVKDAESTDTNGTFNCDISHIEPVKEKSFAPDDFKFNPEFSFSQLEIEDPMAVYLRLQSEKGRTSTPRRKDLQEIEERETEDFNSKIENDLGNKPVFEILEIKDTIDTPHKKTASCLPQIKLSQEQDPISILASSSYVVEEQNRSTGFKVEAIEDGLKNNINGQPISQEQITNSPEITVSAVKEISLSQPSDSSGEEKENLSNDKVIISPEIPVFETEESENQYIETQDDLVNKVCLGSAKTKDSIVHLPEAKKLFFKEKEAPLMAGTSSDSIQQQKTSLLEGDSGIISRRRSSTRSINLSTRTNRRSEMPPLESIRESLESPVQEFLPKPSRKSTISKDFTPRRSLRLAKRREFDDVENLFDVRPSLCGTPTEEESSSACGTTELAYDFDQLDLESTTEQQLTVPQRRMSTRRGNKVSLLYTPPPKGRVSTIGKAIDGDLFSFSPDS